MNRPQEQYAEYFPPVETYQLPSKRVAQPFKIQVMRPPQKRANSRRFQVVYATDGNVVFDMFK